jgi:uncharacterized alpha-E superfamily protein
MTMLSRVADTLYWMSRNLERAEHTARLLDVQLHMMLEAPASAEKLWTRLLDSLYVDAPEAGRNDAYAITRLITFDTGNANSILSCIAAARENARHVREQISSEMWEQVNRLWLQVRSANLDHFWNEQPHEFFLAVKEGIHLFQGITDSTMNHGEGWQFIEVGRYLERTSAVARLLNCHFVAFSDTPIRATIAGDFLQWTSLLKSCTAFEAYCKVYTAELRPDRIIEFLLLNADFPHSIRFSVNCTHAALTAIEKLTESKRARYPNRLAGRLRAALDYAQVDEIVVGGLSNYLDGIQGECQHIHDSIYRAYMTYPIEELVS